MPEQSFLHLHCDVVQDVLVVTVIQHRLDTEKVMEEVRLELFAAVETREYRHVVLDLQNVAMLQTLVLKTLVDLRKQLVIQNGRVLLCGLQPVVREVLRITGFVDPQDASHGLFEATNDVPAALVRLNGAS